MGEKFDVTSYSDFFLLVLHTDNQFEVLVDQDLVNSGSLLEDFEYVYHYIQNVTLHAVLY